MEIEDLKTAKKQIDIKRILIENDETLKKYPVMLWDEKKERLFFYPDDSETKLPYVISKHGGILLLGFFVKTEIYYQLIGNRYLKVQEMFNNFLEYKSL